MSSRPSQRDRGQDLSTFSVNRPNTFTKIDLTPRRYHFYNVLLFIFGTVFPPLAVAARFGIGGDFWLNLLLTICGYIPGHGHNFYIQNIRNNKNHRRTPKWALRYGLVDDTEIRRKEKRSQWAGRYNDRLPQSTLEGRDVEEGQVPDRPAASREGSTANGSQPALWGREEDQFYGQRRKDNTSESNSSTGGGGRWRYPANFDDAEFSPNVTVDIECSQELRTIEATPVFTFHEMAKYFNAISNIFGDVPLGSFNSMFNFTGSWQQDAAATKSLAMIGHVIPLFTVRLVKFDLLLRDEIKRAVPYSWDPASLASFIENYGTHIVTSATIGGRDVVYIKQHQSSPLLVSEIENYVNDIGEQRFSDSKNLSSAGPLRYKDKDVTVIFRRRGGDDLEQSHDKWASTVETSPDVINMTFTPIVSFLEEVPGIKYLSRAIELYLEYKPPIEDLQYFLDFQIARVWAPEQNNLQRKEPVCLSLQFSLMGPKLYISPDQVTVGRKPVTGLRLSLEGDKQNRLSVNLQHLVSLPKILQPHWDSHMAIGAPKWKGPEEQDSRWFEPIKWKNFSHVSTAPIEHTETSIGDLSGVHIVTGAQLGVWNFGAKSVLHLKLLFSKVPGCTIRRSVWDHSPSNLSAVQRIDGSSTSLQNENKKGDTSSQTGKLAKIVDMTEMSKGPQDAPGHWLVTGAKLGVDKGKIVLRVKYSLLNY